MKRSRSPSPAHKSHFESTPIREGRRLSIDRITPFASKKDENDGHSFVSGKWEKVEQNGVKINRAGSSLVYDVNNNRIISAYGQNPNNSFSSTFFQFSLDTNTWSVMSVKGAKPRADAGCCLAENKIWFFGGTTNDDLVKDFHYLDLNTMEVVFPETKGESPPKCETPFVYYVDKQLIVWAPVTDWCRSSLHVLDTTTMTWKRIETDEIYRQGSSGAVIGRNLYVFGVSSPNTVLKLDLDSFEVTLMPTDGEEPPNGLEDLIVTTFGDLIICINTNQEPPVEYFYIFSTECHNWLRISSGDNQIKQNPSTFFIHPKQRKFIFVLQPDKFDEESSTSLAYVEAGKSIAKINNELDLISILALS